MLRKIRNRSVIFRIYKFMMSVIDSCPIRIYNRNNINPRKSLHNFVHIIPQFRLRITPGKTIKPRNQLRSIQKILAELLLIRPYTYNHSPRTQKNRNEQYKNKLCFFNFLPNRIKITNIFLHIICIIIQHLKENISFSLLSKGFLILKKTFFSF